MFVELVLAFTKKKSKQAGLPGLTYPDWRK